MFLLRITVLEFSALLQHCIALYCVLPESTNKTTIHVNCHISPQFCYYYTYTLYLNTYIYQQLTLNTLSRVNTSNLGENLNNHDIISNIIIKE